MNRKLDEPKTNCLNISIADYIKENRTVDINNRKKNNNKYFHFQSDRPREIKLGDSITNLMKSDSYHRVGRRIKQKGWRE